MSKKQNKAKAQKQRKQETVELERELLKTIFPLECEAIPINELSEDEQSVVNKCLNYEELTDFEFKLLKKTLVKYRSSIKKHNPKKAISDAENVINIIKTEQELLDILDEEFEKTLIVNLPFMNKIYQMEFEVQPITDSRAVQSIELQLDIFKDFSESEKQIYAKAQNDQVISQEEQAILQKLTNQINDKAQESQDNIIITFLASQLKIVGSDADLETRRTFWKKFPFNAKVSVFMQVQDKLGLTETKNEELFPALQ